MIEWKRLDYCHLEMVREWRMRPDITHGMYTDPVISPEEQIAWFERIKDDETQIYWIVYKDEKPIGLASLVEIDRRHKKCKSGAYIAEDKSFESVIALENGIFKAAFDILGLNRVEEDVLSNNMRVVKLHEMEGMTKEGILREAIYKNGEYYDVYIFSMLKDEWENGKMRFRYDCNIEM